MSPIPNPAIFGAFGETAVPKTVQTRNTVRTASMKIPSPGPTAGSRVGVPRCVFVAAARNGSKNTRRVKPASSAPMSCAAQYVRTRGHGCFRAIARPNVTAGLK